MLIVFSNVVPLDTKSYLKLITCQSKKIYSNSKRYKFDESSKQMETPLKAFRFDLCYRHLNVIISKENLNEKTCKKVITFQHTFLRGINL